MWFVVAGVLLMLLKWADVAPVAQWSWGLVLLPFGLALAWWAWADGSGYTKRKAMERQDERRDKRRKALMEDLGQSERTGRKR